MSRSIPCYWIEKDAAGNWVRPDTGEVHQHPTQFAAGAVYDASWIHKDWHDEAESKLSKKYPDGIYAVVITPDGPWLIDGPSYDGKQHHPCPWTRTGDPKDPKTLNVTPSIHFPGRYHGHLRNGFLIDA